jgi:hypothetical protein
MLGSALLLEVYVVGCLDEGGFVEEGCLPEGCVVVEVVEGADRVQGDVDLEPPEGGAARCVEDADVGHGARDDEVLDAVGPEEVLDGRAL